MKKVEKMTKSPITPYGRIHGKQEFDDISQLGPMLGDRF